MSGFLQVARECLFSSLVPYSSEEGDSDLTRTMLSDRESLVNLVDVTRSR